MKIRIIENGNLVCWLRDGLLVVGIFIIFISYKYVSPAPFGGLLLLLGLVVAGVGGYSSRAHILKIRPFDNSYKKARKRYEVKDDEHDNTPL